MTPSDQRQNNDGDSRSSVLPDERPSSTVLAQLQCAEPLAGQTGADVAVLFKMLETERQRLEAYVDEQFRQIRLSREALLSDKQVHEQSQQEWHVELERRSRELDVRAREVHEREQHITEQMEEAICERRTFLMPLDDAEDESASPKEVKDLREQVAELDKLVEQLHSERSRALERIDQLRSDLDQVLTERDGQLGEIDQLRRRLAAADTQHLAALMERDGGLAELAAMRLEAEDMARVEAEYAMQRRQVEADRRQLDEIARDLHLREAELRKQLQAATAVAAPAKQRK